MTYTLAIDYGTSFTAAAMLIPGHEPELLEIEDSPRFPSGVVFGADGELVVGRRARAVLGRGDRDSSRSFAGWKT